MEQAIGESRGDTSQCGDLVAGHRARRHQVPQQRPERRRVHPESDVKRLAPLLSHPSIPFIRVLYLKKASKKSPMLTAARKSIRNSDRPPEIRKISGGLPLVEEPIECRWLVLRPGASAGRG